MTHLEGMSQKALFELSAPSTSDDIIEETIKHKEAGVKITELWGGRESQDIVVGGSDDPFVILL